MCVASHVPPARDLASNSGIYPDWESNQQPFGLEASTQSTKPHQPGLSSLFDCSYYLQMNMVHVHALLPEMS